MHGPKSSGKRVLGGESTGQWDALIGDVEA